MCVSKMIQSPQDDENLHLKVFFFRTLRGSEPVREWLQSLSILEKRTIGEDVKTVQFGWPLGMPLVRKLESGLWEIRSTLPTGIARIIFTVKDNTMILLHGFIKKSRKTPLNDLQLARQRLGQLRGE
jgi:phage-related protein